MCPRTMLGQPAMHPPIYTITHTYIHITSVLPVTDRPENQPRAQRQDNDKTSAFQWEETLNGFQDFPTLRSDAPTLPSILCREYGELIHQPLIIYGFK